MRPSSELAKCSQIEKFGRTSEILYYNFIVSKTSLDLSWSKYFPPFINGTEMRTAILIRVKILQRQHEELTPEEIEAILVEPDDSNVAEDDGNLLEEISAAKSVVEILNYSNEGIEKAVNIDPYMTRSLKLKHECEKLLRPYEELYRDLVRRSRQSGMTEFIQKHLI
ncbi:hypothetical protein QAD02_001782 [Eretmocerus hayati]|uniref:Uncharacterized protein n=1 Tax=Eretmocerus hayati TaxID=131215 RepID=A0ACC2NH57_9HYME|nr:hypothetical protein QAD02_001782 [Eretmocerus hayati]